MGTQTEPTAETLGEKDEEDLIRAVELVVEIWAMGGVILPTILYATPFILWSVAFGAFSPVETVVASVLPLIITAGGTAVLIYFFETHPVWEPINDREKVTRRTGLILTVVPLITVLSLIAYDYFLLHEVVTSFQEENIGAGVVEVMQILRVGVYSMICVVVLSVVMLYRTLKR